MLDSLVRVSRRVGRGADRFAADPKADDGGDRARRHARSPSTASSPRTVERATPATGPAPRRVESPRSPGWPTPRRTITLAPEERATFPPGLRQPENRSRRSSRGKCTRGPERCPEPSHEGLESRGQPPTPQGEFRGPTTRSRPFASIRFHVLLNSLFKVLFNFPSRYLSAIGLVPVFSLRWSLPPA